jgi:hypothetical protein
MAKDRPIILGPDGNPVVPLTGATPEDRHKQKKWKIGEIESPPLLGDPEQLMNVMKSAWNGPKGVAFGSNMVTPLETLCFQATSIFAKKTEKRLAKLEDDTGPAMAKKRLTQRLKDHEGRISRLEGRITGLMSLVSDLTKQKKAEAS